MLDYRWHKDMPEEDIKKVWGGNFLRILQQNIDH